MQHKIPLSAYEIENRLKKVPELALDVFCIGTLESVDGTDCIVLNINHGIVDGLEIKFKSPVNCSAVTRLCVRKEGTTEYKIFAFADANGNDVGEVNNLFAANAIVKVILDTDTKIENTDGVAFVQNADTNVYIERNFAELRQIADDLANSAKVQIITWEADD